MNTETNLTRRFALAAHELRQLMPPATLHSTPARV